MKKLSVLFVVLMAVGRVAIAGEVAPAASNTTITLKGEVVKLFYRSENSDKVKVSILDASANVVFSEEIKNKPNFVRPYNLEKLPYGEYTIVLEDKNGKSEEKVSYKKPKTETYATIIGRKEKHKCLVTLFSKGETEVTYRVLDIHNNVLYSQSETINGQAAKSFNLNKTKGAVTVEVSDSNGLLKYKTL